MLDFVTRLLLILVLPALALVSTAPAASTEPGRTGEFRDLISTHYSPLAERPEFIRRAMTPTTADRLLRFQAESETHRLKLQGIDLSKEKFDAYVPRHKPERGYGVLVFVSPIKTWPVPRDWKRELDRLGLIYVAAQESGNAQAVYDRRMPLALHALEWARQTYTVDDQRFYISGFSGGGRVAQRLAFAYADVFSGALLIAGSDAFGDNGTVVPPREIMRTLQTRMRLVYATGSLDMVNKAHDESARQSMREFCVTGLFKHIQSRQEHWIPNGRGFARALVDLDRPIVLPDDHHACREALDRRVKQALHQVEAAIAGADLDAAGEQLAELDSLYGGLAAPRSVELARELAKAKSR